MDANIIYFSIQGTGPQQPTGWGAVIIEDGEMEIFSDSAETEILSILRGLTLCLNRLPKSTPIIIRSAHRSIQKMGKSWITQWRKHGSEQEIEHSDIESLLMTLSTRKIQWFNPPFMDPIDRRVTELATSESAKPPSINDTVQLNNEAIVADIVPPEKVIATPILDTPQTDQPALSEHNKTEPSKDSTSIDMRTRIIAYVDATSHANLGAWCFAMIDKPSQSALFKGGAHRHSSTHRGLLQGCVEILSSLRERSHTVELRTTNIELFQLLNLLIDNPSTQNIPDNWDQHSAFISQLSYWIEQSAITPRLLTKAEQECDAAIQETFNLCVQSISSLNQGHSAEHTCRRKNYPMDTLVN